MAKRKGKLIVLDSDTFKEDDASEGLYPFEDGFPNVEIAETPFSVYEYLRQLDKGKILIQPDFQRNKIWRTTQNSKFIESIILNYPLPPIYLNETKEATYIVIDGLQRTTAISEFYKGSYKLWNKAH